MTEQDKDLRRKCGDYNAGEKIGKWLRTIGGKFCQMGEPAGIEPVCDKCGSGKAHMVITLPDGRSACGHNLIVASEKLGFDPWPECPDQPDGGSRPAGA